ncbi:hypothetical protein GCM10012279_16530 [Micromonospora yangpuensis]|nr:hypothetical protein GCM10012279_16530 [Micromonospora yangpuensis]
MRVRVCRLRVSARSIAVPSIAVTSRPNAYDSGPNVGVDRAASVNTCSVTAAGSLARAFDTAAAVGTPSTRVRGVREITRAATTTGMNTG